ncbi:hypothetical protein WJX74_000629 [Apatococcus lobatus]|uniref:ABC transporter domain-containing protein n=1 Tax=Apatococcus lobatus TaxID=904363 RepID=A0AAW1S2P4_9CHLO
MHSEDRSHSGEFFSRSSRSFKARPQSRLSHAPEHNSQPQGDTAKGGSLDSYRLQDHYALSPPDQLSAQPSEKKLEHSESQSTQPSGSTSDTPEDQSSSNADGIDLDIIPSIPEGERLNLKYEAVSCWVPNNTGSVSLFAGLKPNLGMLRRKRDSNKEEGGKAPANRQILHAATGVCEAGEVLAFMGPSGSSKTTLLTILGDRADKALKREGRITLNGAPLSKQFRRQMGFVLQDDLLYENLTVRETLYYAAMLKLPRSMSVKEKTRRVDTTIKALGIGDCQHTIVGGFGNKGISGGERKRVSVGHELLINPSLLLLDEPTSGLDATTAMHLLSCLRQLASGGRAVITTIHQPSSRLYQQLDKLLLLSKGHQLYFGPAQKVHMWFNQLGAPCPERVSIADFILDLASNDVVIGDRSGAESTQFLMKVSETYLSSHLLEGFNPDTAKTELEQSRIGIQSGKIDEVWDPAQQLEVVINSPDEGAGGKVKAIGRNVKGYVPEAPWTKHKRRKDELANLPNGSSREPGASYLTQLSVLFIRSLRARRQESINLPDFIQFIVVAVLGGCFWYQVAGSYTSTAVQNTLGLLFFVLLFLGLRNMFVALFTFPDEYKIMLKERASGMYKLSAFYIARTISDIPLTFALPLPFLCIVYWMTALRPTATAFFETYFLVIFISLVAESFGLLIGCATMNPKAAQTVAAIVVLTASITGGYLTREMPVWISWIKYLSFVFYSYGMVLHIQYHGTTVYECSSGGENLSGPP